MFTGIITDVGVVQSIETQGGWTRLCIHAPMTAEKVVAGSSVAVSGVCLTVNKIEDGVMEFSLLPQTLAVTDISSWRADIRVNLECALRVGDELGGHFVYGHVDGIGIIAALSSEGESARVRVALPPELMCYTAAKGSIALDGVSLTIADRGDDWIEVALVEYTLDHTTFGEKKVADKIHVECDMLLKFIAGQLQKN